MEKLRDAKRKIKYFLPPALRETRASSHFSSTLPPFLLLLLFLSSSSSSLPLSCNGATDHKVEARVKMERVFRALPRSEQGVSLKPFIKKASYFFQNFQNSSCSWEVLASPTLYLCVVQSTKCDPTCVSQKRRSRKSPPSRLFRWTSLPYVRETSKNCLHFPTLVFPKRAVVS